MKKIATLAFALMVCAPHVAAYAIEDGASSSSSAPDTARSSLATYHGRTIDLRDGWDGAEACYVTDSGTTCFDTEKEMWDFAASTEPTVQAGLKSSLRATSCSSNLVLYDNISFGSPALGLSVRFAVLNLSTYGFDNRTTSYIVGACPVSMWQGSSATGALYPGNTSAGASSPNMVTGWNNTMSSVYIG